jgi:hypothetical protein
MVLTDFSALGLTMLKSECWLTWASTYSEALRRDCFSSSFQVVGRIQLPAFI